MGLVALRPAAAGGTPRSSRRNLTAVAQAASLYAAETTASPRSRSPSELVANTDLRVTIVAADGTVLGRLREQPGHDGEPPQPPEIAPRSPGAIGTRSANLGDGGHRRSSTSRSRRRSAAEPSRCGCPIAVRDRLDRADVARPRAVAAARRARDRARPSRRGRAALPRGPSASCPTAAETDGRGNLAVEMPPVPADLEALADALETLRRQMRSRLDALEAEQRTLRTALDGLTDAVFLLDGDDDPLRQRRRRPHLPRRPRRAGATARSTSVGLPDSLSSAIARRLGSAGAARGRTRARPARHHAAAARGAARARRRAPRTLAVVSDVTERARLDRDAPRLRRQRQPRAQDAGRRHPAAGRVRRDRRHDGDVEQSLEFTRQIEAEAARLKRLVGDLLDLSRLETAPAPDAITDVRQAVDNAIVGHRGAAGRRGLALEVDLSAIQGQDVFVTAEPTDVAVALDNLLDNAIAYTETGSVKIAVQRVRRDRVRIEVSDTGPGIAAEHLPRIFERFYRVDRARSRESGGTGLGLSLVRHVVERSGGSVTVSSEVGVGTTFRVRLQRAR